MAQAKYTVVFEAQQSGLTPAEFAEKAIAVEGKSKCKGFSEGSGLISSTPMKGTFVTLIAESNAEAAKAVRALYGQGTANGKFLVGLSSNLEEVTPIP